MNVAKIFKLIDKREPLLVIPYKYCGVAYRAMRILLDRIATETPRGIQMLFV
jgi:hypothetical protein